jgi:hypothetical protein
MSSEEYPSMGMLMQRVRECRQAILDPHCPDRAVQLARQRLEDINLELAERGILMDVSRVAEP